MTKALIISLYGNKNYGNKLQNYALQNFLLERGIESEILIHMIKRKTQIKHNISLNKVLSKTRFILNTKLINKKCFEKRKANFNIFNKNIKYTDKAITDIEQLKGIVNNYDKIIVGSDQIWGLGISQIPEIAFSTLTDQSKNIAFSASFGVDNIPSEYVDRYKNGLKNFKAISVRENEGAKIVKELIDEDVDVLVDPTMLIKADKWLQLEEKPSFIADNEKYILTYFVEMCSKNRKKEINRFAKKQDLKIISLNDFKDKVAYTIGPNEFLYLINHSNMVITDSFHCCVFSIIFEKDFYVLEREDTNGRTNSRINTLLEKFNISERNIKSLPEEITKCSFTNKDVILNDEVLKAEKFLSEALK